MLHIPYFWRSPTVSSLVLQNEEREREREREREVQVLSARREMNLCWNIALRTCMEYCAAGAVARCALWLSVWNGKQLFQFPVPSRDSGLPGSPARLILQHKSTPFGLPQQQGIRNTCSQHWWLKTVNLLYMEYIEGVLKEMLQIFMTAFPSEL
jgi:hypothetical protein